MKIRFYEPWFFIFFGVFHLHRIWGLIDRKSYADFWLGVLQEKGVIYYSLMALLSILCILGIITLLKDLKHSFWWRWIYLFGGSYLLFDLFAIATGIRFWHDLLMKMFDISSPYWNAIWSAFILLGAAAFTLGIGLLRKRNRANIQ